MLFIIIIIIIIMGAGSHYIVVLKDPTVIENVLRAEGKYPVRDTVFTPKFAWLFKNRGKAPITFPFE